MKIHTILILAGGDGGRFYPLQDKMRFRFSGEPFLHVIARLIQEYTEHIVIVCNEHNKEQFKKDFSDFPVTFIVQKKIDGGMADAILAAESSLTKDALILNGNDIFDFSIIPILVDKTRTEGANIGFVAKHMKNYFSGGYVVFDEERAVRLIEKPSPDKIPSQYVKLVVDYFPEPKLFIDELKKLSSSDDQNERALTVLMNKKPAVCIKYSDDWATIKYSWDVLKVQEYFFKHLLTGTIDESANIHKTATIEGEVNIGKNVKVGAYCKITGPCYIGDNVVIGDHSLIRSSTIERNSLVGSGCEVARSYLGPSVMLHRNYVGDSVLSESVSMGAGAVTANYRFDTQTIKTPVEQKMVDSQARKLGLIAGKNVKIGVNATTYPGVKLSAQTLVLPGEVVKKDR